MIGASSQIEFINRAVCTQGEHFVDSWALSWVSIQNGTGGPNNILQTGYAKCGVSSSCGWNGGNSYVWYYYGRNAGPCGAKFQTGVVKIYNVSSGLHDFAVLKSGTHYNVTVVSVVEAQRSVSDIETCWEGGGASSAGWYNEMLNNGDQGGGPSTNHQSLDNNAYLTGTGWHSFTHPLNSLCVNTAALPNWHCQWSGSYSDRIYTWDDRFP
jgi:hypothetical protein